MINLQRVLLLYLWPESKHHLAHYIHCDLFKLYEADCLIMSFVSLRRSPKPPIRPVGISENRNIHSLQCIFVYDAENHSFFSLSFLQRPDLKPREFESKCLH